MKYNPHNYQAYATDFILEHPVSAVFLDMGLGKSIITLSAIFDLCLDSFLVRKVLVIAPLRVARDTWPAEIHKWDHLRGLTYSVAVGSETERKAALRQKVSVYIINRENVQWLIEESGIPFDYDMVVIDELSSFKSYQAKRFRSLMKVRPTVKRIVGLTGTPSSNGLMDLWAEFRILDMGKRLGRYITHYRNAYFQPDKRNGQVVFSYKPLPGAEEKIYDAISDITISMKAADHLQMPECVINEVKVTLSEKERKTYDSMRSELVVSLGVRKSMPETLRHLQTSSRRWQTVLSTERTNVCFRYTTASWTHWRISSKPPTGNLSLWRTGSSTTWSESPNGCIKGIFRSAFWTIPTVSADGTVANCLCTYSSGIRRTRFEPASRRFHTDMVRTHMEFGALSADKCSSMATGSDRRYRGHSPHHYERYH